jgi:hypothetical protein
VQSRTAGSSQALSTQVEVSFFAPATLRRLLAYRRHQYAMHMKSPGTDPQTKYEILLPISLISEALASLSLNHAFPVGRRGETTAAQRLLHRRRDSQGSERWTSRGKDHTR